MTKITFHSGITSIELFDLLAKTMCQLKITHDEFGTFKWVLSFDKNNLEENEDENGIGLIFKTQCRIGEEFIFTIPISGEKAKVCFF